ncbi:uncharacterized protein AMSG_03363 [Thecamonas trahens ATCC 50062]|uniref:CRAL-TRIO domain-containing protein n=1 Tax=Thecamonas trahens ATCC 50062 TaxID=461836 RepID=A0A0L0D496_THETB|nr:hypothetical protein AMSG_03363 [Thecamonas trahens ATCC 50062]KNC46931.1 hypothetical protein AMSG_03363 [Thecamonas trahens ATCC 50062]|eukprot:XP_013760203.1 hypothetical protein AMSG_03363 [Thecamonas trahens ATCC 50062]
MFALELLESLEDGAHGATSSTAYLLQDETLVRFLRARKCDVEAAASMVIECARWRVAFRPQDLRCEGRVRSELQMDKFVAMGQTKSGQPSFLIFAGRHNPAESPLENVVAAVVWMLELMEKRMAAYGVDKCTILMDYSGWGYANMDNKMTQEVLQIIQNYYPERLGRAFMINTPWLFKGAWRVISPFLDANTKSKVVFTGSDYGAELREYFDSDQLADSHGGTMHCAFDLNAFLAEEASYEVQADANALATPAASGLASSAVDESPDGHALTSQLEAEVTAILRRKPKRRPEPAHGRGCVSPSAMPLGLVMRRYADEDLVGSNGEFAGTPRPDWTPRESANPIVFASQQGSAPSAPSSSRTPAKFMRLSVLDFSTDSAAAAAAADDHPSSRASSQSSVSSIWSSVRSLRARASPAAARSATRSVTRWITRGPGLNLGDARPASRDSDGSFSDYIDPAAVPHSPASSGIRDRSRNPSARSNALSYLSDGEVTMYYDVE